MREFIQRAIKTATLSPKRMVIVDFQKLRSISPEGVVVISNLLQYFRGEGLRVEFVNHDKDTPANRYLDDAGLFNTHFGHRVFENSAPRHTMMPLHLFKAKAYLPHLYFQLMPWIAREVNLSEDTLAAMKACLEEVFHNIEYHSGVAVAGTFSEHMPEKKEICIAVSDFGVGIPKNVRTVIPRLPDASCLAKACEYGFTSKSNVLNRGWGLPNLIRNVAQRNSGVVSIHSSLGFLEAIAGKEDPVIRYRQMKWQYPGTLVHVILRTDTLERLENEVAPEKFQW